MMTMQDCTHVPGVVHWLELDTPRRMERVTAEFRTYLGTVESDG